MSRTFYALTHVDLGFDAAKLLHARMTLPPGRYQTMAQQTAFIRQVVAHVESLPGVASASFSLEDTAITGGPPVEFDVPGEANADRWTATLGASDETYFQTMGRTILRGAAFSAAEIDTARHGAIVNQAFVRTYFPRQEALGHTIHFHVEERWRDAPDDANFEITGVVSDARNHGLRDAVQPQIFVSYSAFHVPPVGIMVRTRVAPLSLLENIRRQVWAVDPNVALTRVGTVEDSISEAFYAEPRFGLVAIGGFAAIGLVLVVVGVFSVMAYSVSTRKHEIGIRMAVGAQPGHVLAMVLRQGLALMGAGAALGLAASLALTRLIASQLWGVAPNDPATLLAVCAAVLSAGAAACLVPARRAARVGPAEALRQ
jgi:putative ABC transport system permease protein